MAPGRAFLIACVLLGSAPAHADDKADKAEAAKLYEQGKRHYNLAEWDEAIASFRAAYKLDPDPVNLFNIAQAYRLKKGHCADAATFYASYQRVEKNKKLRDSVTKVRKDMEECAKTEPPPEPPPAAPTEPPPPPTPPAKLLGSDVPPTSPPPFTPTGDNAMRPLEAPADPDPNRNRRTFGKVVMVGGGVLVAVGIGLSVKVSGLDDRLAGCDDFGCDDGSDPEKLQAQRDRAAAEAGAAWGTGIIALAAGGLIYLVSRKPKTDKPRVTAVPMRGGAGVSWSF